MSGRGELCGATGEKASGTDYMLWKWLLRKFDPCSHRRLGRLWFRADDGQDYQRCLDCGELVATGVQLGECKTPPWGEQVGLTIRQTMEPRTLLHAIETGDLRTPDNWVNGEIRRDRIGPGDKDFVN